MNLSAIMARAREENHLCTVLLELTYACNLNCTFCYNDIEATGQRMTLDDYRILLDDLAAMGTLGVTLTGGEPLLHPDFFEIGEHARQRGFTITVKSNGVTLNRRNAERLKAVVDPWMVEFSLHGATPETHDRLTRQAGSLDRMVENIRRMRGMGFRMRLNGVLTKWNEHETEHMYALADDLGLPLTINTEITPRDNGDMSPLALTASSEGRAGMFRLVNQRVLDANARQSSAKMQSIPLHLPAMSREAEKRRPQKSCGAGSTSLAIDPFGNAYPCVQLRTRAGNVHEQSVKEIWYRSGTLERVRHMSYQAREQALGAGISSYCMGSARLITGDPLKIHDDAVEIDRVQKLTRHES